MTATFRSENGALSIVLRGDLAALLQFALDKQKPSSPSATGLSLLSQGSLGERTGFGLYRAGTANKTESPKILILIVFLSDLFHRTGACDEHQTAHEA